MKLDNISTNILENNQKNISKIYEEHLNRLIQIDTKSNSLINISVLILTIQITIITEIIFNIITRANSTFNIITLVGILLFVINILFNMISLINFKNASQLLIMASPFDIGELTTNLENTDYKKQLLKNILNYNNAINNNNKIIENKTTYINKGLKNILISLIILIFSIFFLSLSNWWI